MPGTGSVMLRSRVRSNFKAVTTQEPEKTPSREISPAVEQPNSRACGKRSRRAWCRPPCSNQATAPNTNTPSGSIARRASKGPQSWAVVRITCCTRIRLLLGIRHSRHALAGRRSRFNCNHKNKEKRLVRAASRPISTLDGRLIPLNLKQGLDSLRKIIYLILKCFRINFIDSYDNHHWTRETLDSSLKAVLFRRSGFTTQPPTSQQGATRPTHPDAFITEDMSLETHPLLAPPRIGPERCQPCPGPTHGRRGRPPARWPSGRIRGGLQGQDLGLQLQLHRASERNAERHLRQPA